MRKSTWKCWPGLTLVVYSVCPKIVWRSIGRRSIRTFWVRVAPGSRACESYSTVPSRRNASPANVYWEKGLNSSPGWKYRPSRSGVEGRPKRYER